MWTTPIFDLGNQNIPQYIVLSFFIFYFFCRRSTFSAYRGLFIAAYLFRLTLALIYAQILIHAYNFGDFYIYHLKTQEIAEALARADFEPIRAIGYLGTGFAVICFALPYLLLGPSLFGLVVLAATIVHVSFMYMFELLRPDMRLRRAFAIGLLFLPSIVLQSSYVGKETIFFPALAILLYCVRNYRFGLPFILCLLWIYMIRPQQVALLVAPLGLYLLRPAMQRTVTAVLYGGAVIATLALGVSLYQNLRSKFEISPFDLGAVFEAGYSGGGLTLRPLPGPFLLLQSFRPFPWEAESLLAFLQSVDSLWMLLVILAALTLRRGILRALLPGRDFHGYLFYMALGYLIVFGFNPNLGDVSRRRPYYLPFLLAAVCVSADAVGRRRRDDELPDAAGDGLPALRPAIAAGEPGAG